MTSGFVFSQNLIGQNLIGVIVALTVVLSSGMAFLICVREVVREYLQREKSESVVVRDSVFETLLSERASRTEPLGDGWYNRRTYLATVGFLGCVALAGVFAGLGHFV